MDWNEIAATVSNLNRWLRPLKALEEIPQAIEAAKLEVVRMEEAITQKKAEINDLKNEAAKSQKKLEKIDQDYQKAWNERVVQLDKDIDTLRGNLMLEIDSLTKQREAEEKALGGVINDQKAFRDKMAAEKVKLNEEIDALKAQLETYRQTITAVLGK